MANIAVVIVSQSSLLYLNNRPILKYLYQNLSKSSILKEDNIYFLTQLEEKDLEIVADLPLLIKDKYTSQQEMIDTFLIHFDEDDQIILIDDCAVFLDDTILKECINTEFESEVIRTAKYKNWYSQLPYRNFDSVASLVVNHPDRYLYAQGILAFDYMRYREDYLVAQLQNYRELSKKNKGKKIIVGDSRLYPMQFEHYDNYSINGVSLHAFKQAIPYILRNEIEEIVLALGINDFHYGYGTEEIISCFKEVLQACQGIQIKIFTLVHVLNRMQLDNQEIARVNQFLNTLNYPIIDLNTILAKNQQLKLEYSFDGLHFNYKAYRLIQAELERHGIA